MSNQSPVRYGRRAMLTAAGASLALATATNSGCFGSFALTRKIYNFNKGVQNKWLRWLVFLLFYVIPVYGFGALIDALVFNTIEFWTGKEALASGKTLQDGDAKAVVVEQTPERVVYELRRGDQKVTRVAMTRLDDAVLLETEGGQRMYVRDAMAKAEQHTQILDAQGEVIAQMNADQWTQTQRRVQAGQSHALAMRGVMMGQGPNQARI